jgi:hypothetical protein
MFWCAAVPVGFGAVAAQTIDKREYVDWNLPEYQKIVLFYPTKDSICTAQYVDRNIILTAMHCLHHKTKRYKFKRSDGRVGTATLLKHGVKNDNTYDDWALLQVDGMKNESEVWFDIADTARLGPIENAGFGWMRIVSDEEIQKMKEIFDEIKESAGKFVSFRDVEEEISKRMRKSGIKKLEEFGKDAKLKHDGTCKIQRLKEISKLITHQIDGCYSNLKNEDSETVDDIITDFLKDNNPQFKANKDGYDISIDVDTVKYLCGTDDKDKFYKSLSYVTTDNKYKFVFDFVCDKTCPQRYAKDEFNWFYKSDAQFFYNCHSFGGNSGGAIYFGNTLFGIVSSGGTSFMQNNYDRDKDESETGINSYIFKQEFLALKRQMSENAEVIKAKSASIVTKPETPEKIIEETVEETIVVTETENIKELEDILVSETEIEVDGPDLMFDLETRIEDTEEYLDKGLNNITEMTDAEFLKFLSKTTELNALRNRYEKAKASETSLANRLLGAAAIGAGGIGGMMALSGMAEKSADENAERDMKAYLQTMTCDYGDGRNIKGGQTDVILPGANVLLPLHAEYRDIAARLRESKEALGLAPSIESEAVIDKADGGLYDNGAIGKTGGAYTSVSRALTDENGADAAAWAEQKSAAESQTKTGGIIGGTGVLGGAVGNLLINNSK